MTIYILKGATGEYSDYTEWMVKGFTNELPAKDYCSVLNDKLQLMELHMENENADRKYFERFKWHPEDRSLMDKEIMELDKRFQLDYTGTKYWIETLEVE